MARNYDMSKTHSLIIYLVCIKVIFSKLNKYLLYIFFMYKREIAIKSVQLFLRALESKCSRNKLKSSFSNLFGAKEKRDDTKLGARER